MSQTTDLEDLPETNPRQKRRDFALRACFSRHRTLSSTWDLFTLFGMSTEDHFISATCRNLVGELAALAQQGPAGREENALDKIHSRLDSLESEMRSVARDVTLEQMRSALPTQVRKDRRSVLDLLDLMLSADGEGVNAAAGRSSTVDYLITLLCIDGGDAITIQDPVTLTPRMFGLCEQASDFPDARIPEIEAEFLAAANQPDSNWIRHRKSDLGDMYFVPQILRAVISLNATQWRSTVDDTAQQLTEEPALNESYADDANSSVFNTSLLPRLADALRRRIAGDAQTESAIDRIAWCVDIGYASSHERTALRGSKVGYAEDLNGTVVLVGLLCNSAIVITEELEMIGLSIARLTGDWTHELSNALKREIDASIANNLFDAARKLSELRTKFLYAPVANEQPQIRTIRSVPVRVSKVREFRDEAKELACNAVAMDQGSGRADPVAWHAIPFSKIVASACFLVTVGVVGVLGLQVLHPADGLVRVDRDDVKSVSPFLAEGRRSADGTGSTFVGRIEDDWLELEPDVQQELAAEIVDSLRSRGVREIMIFDRDDILRIQALGQQSAKSFAVDMQHPASS